MSAPITIVGGGLAGLLLGNLLRQKDVPVVLHETGDYPRHRVCGEFLSGRGVEVLRASGLLPDLLQAGATWGEQVAFFSEKGRLHGFDLPHPALCLSRFAFDEVLARAFREHGGQLETGSRFRLPKKGSPSQPGLVLATGRRRRNLDRGWRWFGLKVHAADLELEADLEMHLHPDAYIGACRIEGDRVNLCGLFRRRGDRPSTELSRPEDLLRGIEGSPLWERTEGARFLRESRCAVAGLDLHPRKATAHAQCSVGDAVTMIPPLTGNGMSMALESAAAAADPIARFSEGALSWSEAADETARAVNEEFSQRLRWAQGIQRMLFAPLARPLLLASARHSRGIWKAGFLKTR